MTVMFSSSSLPAVWLSAIMLELSSSSELSSGSLCPETSPGKGKRTAYCCNTDMSDMIITLVVGCFGFSPPYCSIESVCNKNPSRVPAIVVVLVPPPLLMSFLLLFSVGANRHGLGFCALHKAIQQLSESNCTCVNRASYASLCIPATEEMQTETKRNGGLVEPARTGVCCSRSLPASGYILASPIPFRSTAGGQNICKHYLATGNNSNSNNNNQREKHTVAGPGVGLAINIYETFS